MPDTPPNTMLSTIQGHEEVTQHFAASLQRNRLASTYLFVGPESVGKRTLALALAKSLLCTTSPPDSLDACGICDSCQLCGGGTHPDLLIVQKPDGKSTLPLSLFVGEGDKRNREGLCHDISLKPFVGRRRIAIIDDADDLGIESANCLLKTLEEPPPRSVIILIGTSLSRQLPTIRSRSQVIRFGELNIEQIAAILRAEALLPKEQIAAAAEQSAGTLKRALAATDETSRQLSECVTNMITRPGSPVVFAQEIIALSAAGNADPPTKRVRLRTALDTAIAAYRTALRQSVEDPASVEVYTKQLDHALAALDALARNANQATLVQTWANQLVRTHDRQLSGV